MARSVEVLTDRVTRRGCRARDRVTQLVEEQHPALRGAQPQALVDAAPSVVGLGSLGFGPRRPVLLLDQPPGAVGGVVIPTDDDAPVGHRARGRGGIHLRIRILVIRKRRRGRGVALSGRSRRGGCARDEKEAEPREQHHHPGERSRETPDRAHGAGAGLTCMTSAHRVSSSWQCSLSVRQQSSCRGW